MTYVLVLTLIMAAGPKQSFLEVASLAECWSKASAVIEKITAANMKDAEVIGVGAGCYSIPNPNGAL